MLLGWIQEIERQQLLDGVIPLPGISTAGFVAVIGVDMAVKVGWRDDIAAAEAD